MRVLLVAVRLFYSVVVAVVASTVNRTSALWLPSCGGTFVRARTTQRTIMFPRGRISMGNQGA